MLGRLSSIEVHESAHQPVAAYTSGPCAIGSVKRLYGWSHVAYPSRLPTNSSHLIRGLYLRTVKIALSYVLAMIEEYTSTARALSAPAVMQDSSLFVSVPVALVYCTNNSRG